MNMYRNQDNITQFIKYHYKAKTIPTIIIPLALLDCDFVI